MYSNHNMIVGLYAFIPGMESLFSYFFLFRDFYCIYIIYDEVYGILSAVKFKFRMWQAKKQKKKDMMSKYIIQIIES